MSRAMNQRSVAIELPHSGAFRASGCGCGRTAAPAPAPRPASSRRPGRRSGRTWCACRARRAHLVNRLGRRLDDQVDPVVEQVRSRPSPRTRSRSARRARCRARSSRSRSRPAGRSSPRLEPRRRSSPRPPPARLGRPGQRPRMCSGTPMPGASVGSGCCSPNVRTAGSTPAQTSSPCPPGRHRRPGAHLDRGLGSGTASTAVAAISLRDGGRAAAHRPGTSCSVMIRRASICSSRPGPAGPSRRPPRSGSSSSG